MHSSADLILYNARVITLDEQNPFAEAVAIKGNHVLTACSAHEVTLLKGEGTKMLDCQGMTVIPGFNDAHCHPIGQAMTLLHVDCSPAKTASIKSIQQAIRERGRDLPEGAWIRAAQYNELGLADNKHPSRWDLDEAAPNHPVILVHYSGGNCVLNSRALRELGITSYTSEDIAGSIVRDTVRGEPNGMICGFNAAVQEGLPRIGQDELTAGMKVAGQLYLSNGITSLQDTSWNNTLANWQTYQSLKGTTDVLPCRVSMMLGSDGLNKLADVEGSEGLSMGMGNTVLRIGGVKIARDESTCNPQPPQHEVDSHALKAHEAGYKLCFHVHDQYNMNTALHALEMIRSKSNRQLLRPRFEHCMVCTPDLLQRLMEYNPLIVTQPSFIYFNGDDFCKTVEQDQLRFLFPIASYQRQGLQVALSSDSPMLPCNPLLGIFAAVSRVEQYGKTLASEEGISPYEALKMYTLNGAWASDEQAVKGKIASGLLADLVVLSSDPTNIEIEAIKDISVVITIIDGKVVWER